MLCIEPKESIETRNDEKYRNLMPSKKRRAEDKPINSVKKPLAHATNKFQSVTTENEQLEWALEQSKIKEPMQIGITKPNLSKEGLPNHQKIGENHPPKPKAAMTENEQLKWALEQSRLEEPMQIEITKKQNQLSQTNLPKGQLISKCPFGVIVSTKIPTKNLTISALESKKW